MEDLGDGLPLTVDLDKGQEVGVVGARGVALHIDADDGGCLRDGENIVAGLDVGSATLFLYESPEISDRTSKHIRLGRADETVHDSVLVECLGRHVCFTDTETLDVFIRRGDDGIVFDGRDGLDIGGHYLLRAHEVSCLLLVFSKLDFCQRLTAIGEAEW